MENVDIVPVKDSVKVLFLDVIVIRAVIKAKIPKMVKDKSFLENVYNDMIIMII